MKKIVLNISDVLYEKLRFEAIHEKKSVVECIQTRIFHKPFDPEVEEAFDQWMEKEIDNITGGK